MSLDPSSGEQVAELFDSLFEIRTADTADVLDQVYALRYQVYCVENRFLPADAYEGERERDEFDQHSKHAALVYRPNQEIVGCVRLVLPYADGREPRPIPMHALLGAEARQRLDQYDPMTLAEISRYAVSKQFRRRAGEHLYADVGLDTLVAPDPRRLLPHVSLGLFRAVARLAIETQVDALCAAMAPSLLRLIERFGWSFVPVGPPIEYHGSRQPCIAETSALREQLERQHAGIARFIVQG